MRIHTGTFNFARQGPSSILYFEDVLRAVRGMFAGETVVASRRVATIRGLLCFFDERVEVEIDGELQERPITRFSLPSKRTAERNL